MTLRVRSAVSVSVRRHLGQLLHPQGQVAVRVQRLDDRLAQAQLVRTKAGHAELLQEVIAQGRGAGEHVLVGGRVLVLAHDAFVARAAGGVFAQVVLPVEFVVDLAVYLHLTIGRGLGGGFNLGCVVARSLRFLAIGTQSHFALWLGPGVQFRLLHVLGGLFGNLQQGIFQEFLVDALGQLQAVELQQFDGLLQLGSHHQLLAEP